MDVVSLGKRIHVGHSTEPLYSTLHTKTVTMKLELDTGTKVNVLLVQLLKHIPDPIQIKQSYTLCSDRVRDELKQLKKEQVIVKMDVPEVKG